MHVTDKMLGRAIAIAAEVHALQEDKVGEPYVLHVIEVMRRAEEYYLAKSGGAAWQLDEVRTAAVLHDVVEDFEGDAWEKQRLRDRIYAEFPHAVYAAVDALTKQVERVEGDRVIYEPYLDSYVERVKHNWIARLVKIADLSHNLDAFRVPPNAGPKDFKRWEKYHRALVALTQEEEAARAT